MPSLQVVNLNLSAILPHMEQPFNFKVASGCCMGISGPSGIGKSVLLKAIADMIAHRGEIFLGDLESRSVPAPEWRKKVALMPAESQWWCQLVGEHFNHYDEQLFSHFGFENNVMQWQINRLSSGEKQRLAIIRVLMNQPGALLLDEPTANLDAENRQHTETLVAEYQASNKVPVIWISHDKDQLARVSQQMLTLTQRSYEVSA